MYDRYVTTRYTKKMIIIGILVLIGLFVLSQYLWLRLSGTAVPPPTIERITTDYGNGKQVKYSVLGDSSVAGQGGDYSQGLAVSTARHLAQDNKVTMLNTAVSGARAADIISDQLEPTLKHNPDIVLIVIGSNDVTHLTKLSDIRKSVSGAVDKLVSNNCNVKIVLTGSAAMGTVPRLPQPLRFFAGVRTQQVNSVFKEIVNQKQLTFAPIAAKTGPIFAKDHTLFAQDNFHPNTKGYDVWVPVLNDALDEALSSQPSHCN